MIKKAYVSGALTGVPNPAAVKQFYEDIASVCAAQNLEAYVPHLVSDPIKNPGLTPAEVYTLDRERVVHADLVIAYVGAPSLGVGMEIEIARAAHVPVVLLMEDSVPVSRMARGNPAVAAEIRFCDYADGLEKLSAWLRESGGRPEPDRLV